MELKNVNKAGINTNTSQFIKMIKKEKETIVGEFVRLTTTINNDACRKQEKEKKMSPAQCDE